MNAKLAGEERRHVRKLAGDQAVAAIEVYRKAALDLSLKFDGLANIIAKDRELALERHDQTTRRIDAVAAWCDQNEKATKALPEMFVTNQHLERTFEVIGRIATDRYEVTSKSLRLAHKTSADFRDMGFLQRLRWLFFGPKVPR